jgi:hypothetical protein
MNTQHLLTGTLKNIRGVCAPRLAFASVKARQRDILLADKNIDDDVVYDDDDDDETRSGARINLPTISGRNKILHDVNRSSRLNALSSLYIIRGFSKKNRALEVIFTSQVTADASVTDEKRLLQANLESSIHHAAAR